MQFYFLAMGFYLFQTILIASLFWRQSRGQSLLALAVLQMFCWTMVFFIEEPTALFMFGLEQSSFWASVLCATNWIDWSRTGRSQRHLLGLSITGLALSVFLQLFGFDMILFTPMAQLAVLLMLALLLVKSASLEHDRSHAAFFGGFIGLISVQFLNTMAIYGSDRLLEPGYYLCGALVLSMAGSLQLVWAVRLDYERQLARLQEELDTRPVVSDGGADSPQLLPIETSLQRLQNGLVSLLEAHDIQFEISNQAVDLCLWTKADDFHEALMILARNSCAALEHSHIKRIAIDVKSLRQQDQEWLKIKISDSGRDTHSDRSDDTVALKSNGHGDFSAKGLARAAFIIRQQGGFIQLDAEAMANTYVLKLPAYRTMKVELLRRYVQRA